MLVFKLSLKNMKKSLKDYAIYFLTLVLGVAIFYMFNSIDSQQAMLEVSSAQTEMIKLMIGMLSFVSVFVSVILGLLIVYANNFLINRRKKEFGIYMTLGMGKRQISKIILIETLFVGIISLVVGLFLGIFASQFMSILVAKLFEANMSEFTFVFSKSACIKTCFYFAVMYFAVMIFNTLAVSRYKLINLINANRQNEKVKIRNPILAILIFVIGTLLLSYAYYIVAVKTNTLREEKDLIKPILLGLTGTLSIFWSLSGFILTTIQKIKKVYLKDTNMFVLRQINNKINTTVISMSIICIMLFLTITILSSSLSLRNSMQGDLIEMTPVDINLEKTANLQEVYKNQYGKEEHTTLAQREDSKVPISETLKNNGLDMSVLKDIVEIPIYTQEDLTLEKFLGNKFDEIKKGFPFLMYDMAETIIKVSDYNKIAELYKVEKYSLNEDEYIMLCDFDSQVQIRNKALASGTNDLEIAGKIYKSKYNECKEGFINMSTSHTNTGILLVPDSCNLTDKNKEKHFLAANYNETTDEGKEEIEKIFTDSNSNLIQNLDKNGIEIDGVSKITIIQSSLGLTTIIIFIAIYLGLIFLIASSVILALKQLTESSDNKERYAILRKIGCDERMINKSLFSQIAIFFGMPLILAIIHSIFGIKFALNILSGLTMTNELIPSIILTTVLIGGIYGAYFLATYFESKNIIKEEG